MAYLALQPHVGYALVDDRPVFLDIRRDRYFALDGAAERGFLAARRSNGRIDPHAEPARRLIATGLFSFEPEPGPLPAPTIGRPERGLSGDLPLSRLRAADLLSIWLLLARARRQVRAEPLEHVLELRRARRVSNERKDARDVEALCARFRRARALVPVRPTCLQDSLALRDWLAARDASAAIVFGVKLDPFAAHCWLQSGDTVLNDAPDKVREFTPILVVP